jgi:predicted small secreted protein
MKRHVALRVPVAILMASFVFSSCNVMKELGQAVTNLSRCTFKLSGISNFQIAGISLSGKPSQYRGRFAAAFGRGSFPTTFTLNGR